MEFSRRVDFRVALIRCSFQSFLSSFYCATCMLLLAATYHQTGLATWHIQQLISQTGLAAWHIQQLLSQLLKCAFLHSLSVSDQPCS